MDSRTAAGIRATTRLLAVLGHPVSHSLSPAMHNAAIAALGLDLLYIAHDVEPRNLDDVLKGLRKAGYLGVNLTIPHKEAAVRLCTKISPEARLARSVNTLRFGADGIYGDTTDGAGLLDSLKAEFGFSPKGKRIVILGAGGTARSVAAALAGTAKTIHIANRTVEKADHLAALMNRAPGKTLFTSSMLDQLELAAPLQDAQLVINTTSASLTGAALPRLPWKILDTDTIAVDVMYGRPTKFLADAKRHGLRHSDGLGMLVHQGARALRIWTGRNPDTRIMREAARKALKQGR
ncbi:MAG: shikimate dehydrogenase [Deltaproteobacteria bacterium]|nr:shikimate dehydrogenase [Deltaproteobacteria bacterium]